MASDKQVPTTANFAEIYTDDAAPVQRKRWNALFAAFTKQYDGKTADFVSRSPGRVNVIGEVSILRTWNELG